MSGASATLTDQFVQLATAATVATYKHVQVQAAYYRPDRPLILQLFETHMYDRLNIGLDDVVLIRAALDNPDHAQTLLDYAGKHGSKDVSAEQARHVTNKVAKHFQGQDNGAQAAREDIERMKQRTDEALAARLKFACKTNFSVRLRFQNAAADLMNIEFAPEVRYFERVKSFLKHWITTLDGPLHSVDLEVRNVSSRDELREAVSHLDSFAKGKPALAQKPASRLLYLN